ncbi:MAG: hypothetical protein AB7O62_01605 [Pirellulales bacterium]
MRYLLPTLMCVGIAFNSAMPVQGRDAFDRHNVEHLRSVGKEAQPLTELTSRQAAELKMLGAGFTSPAVVLKTDSGNWVKALLSWGLRKGPEKPVPVLLIERYVTYDGTRRGSTTASGKDIMLFAGYQFDFDIGQVVPAGFGGDIAFNADRKIVPAEGVQLFGLDGPVPEVAANANKAGGTKPTDHDGVLAKDYAGEWRIVADGRWRGTLELQVDGDGNVEGQYTSDDTKSTYKVIGKVDIGSHRMVMDVELANSAQLYEAYLWTTDKSTFAGITTLSEQRFGFYATRVVEAETDEAASESPAAKPAE